MAKPSLKRRGRYTKSSTEFLRKPKIKTTMKNRKAKRKSKMSNNKKRKALHKPPRYFSVEAVVVMEPTETCRMYRNNMVYQKEVLTKCVLIRDDVKTPYPVRFVHDRTLEIAKKLHVGSHISLEQARFKTYPGRKEIEVHVKRLSIIR